MDVATIRDAALMSVEREGQEMEKKDFNLDDSHWGANSDPREEKLQTAKKKQREILKKEKKRNSRKNHIVNFRMEWRSVNVEKEKKRPGSAAPSSGQIFDRVKPCRQKPATLREESPLGEKGEAGQCYRVRSIAGGGSSS